jgi:hypothetical protein
MLCTNGLFTLVLIVNLYFCIGFGTDMNQFKNIIHIIKNIEDKIINKHKKIKHLSNKLSLYNSDNISAMLILIKLHIKFINKIFNCKIKLNNLKKLKINIIIKIKFFKFLYKFKIEFLVLFIIKLRFKIFIIDP